MEAAARLAPGARVVLHVVDVRGAHTIHGTVVRCWVCALDRSAGVLYRAALAFERWFVWPDDESAVSITEHWCEPAPAPENQNGDG